MKSFIAIAFSFCSLAAFSADPGAVDTLLSVLPTGTHTGEKCSVTVNVADYPEKSVYVSVTNEHSTIFKIVADASEFYFKAHKKEFIQTDRISIDDTRSSFVERIIRTVLADDKKLYVVVAEEVTVNRERRVEEVECVVNL